MIPASVQLQSQTATRTESAAGAAAGARPAPRVRLSHRTCYEYDRPVWLSAHEIRLRPAAHVRVPIESYALRITPVQHDLKWHQDAYGNWVARVLFSQSTALLGIEVELTAMLPEINPFDFFVAHHASQYPFEYSDEERHGLMAYLATEAPGPHTLRWLERMRNRLLCAPIDTVEFLVAVNRWIADEVRYVRRAEPGIQDSEQTLVAGSGSCRDSARLLMDVLRHCGIAARFVSGYLVELGRGGAFGEDVHDSLALHAWCEAYLPGGGWIGLDPSSGLLTTEGHIPLACAALPHAAAAVSGSTEIARSRLLVDMHASRVVAPARGIAGR
jgi:transglutaminase-like putative cysteine protease